MKKKPLVIGSNGEPEELSANDSLTSSIAMWMLGRNRTNLGNQYLRTGGTMPSNTMPYVVNGAMEIAGVSAHTDNTATWTIEIYKNDDIIASPNSANRILAIAMNSTDIISQVLATPISLNNLDKLAVYLRGTGVNRPMVTVHFRKKG